VSSGCSNCLFPKLEGEVRLIACREVQPTAGVGVIWVVLIFADLKCAVYRYGRLMGSFVMARRALSLCLMLDDRWVSGQPVGKMLPEQKKPHL